MTGDLELDGGTLSVRDVAGAINPVPTPDGYAPLFFRSLVAAVDTFWSTHGTTPSLEQLRKIYAGGRDDQVAALLQTPEFEKAITYRGVTWKPELGLSLDQQAALRALSDPFDKRTNGTKLRELGITPSTHHAWMKNPMYASILNQRAEDNMRNANATALNTIVSKADSGDLRAAEKVLEITGRYNPNDRAVDDARQVVQRFMEAVVKHVRDPETLKAIVAEAKAASLTLEIAESQRGIGS